MEKTIKKVVQPQDIFKLLEVKDIEEARKVFNTALNFLLYLNSGDILETKNANFTKLSSDLFHIEYKFSLGDVVDTLEKKKIISFPF